VLELSYSRVAEVRLGVDVQGQSRDKGIAGIARGIAQA
jgi:hypothetical protein